MRAHYTPPLYDRVLELVSTETGPRWKVRYICCELDSKRMDFLFDVDATDGSVNIQPGG